MEESATSQAVSAPSVDDTQLGSPVASNDQVQGTDTSTVNDDVSTQAIEESFTSVDPKSLPPELQGTYKSLMKDYTQKTQGLSEFRKKADAFDTLMSNDQFTRLMDMVNNIPQQQTQHDAGPPTSMSGEELLLEILEKGPERLNELIEQRAKALIDPLADDIYAEKAQKEYQELLKQYPDLPQHEDDIAKVIEKSNYTLTPHEAYKIVTYDKVKQQGINEGVEVATKRSHAAQPDSSKAAVTPSNRPLSVQDAFKQAQEALGWTGNN